MQNKYYWILVACALSLGPSALAIREAAVKSAETEFLAVGKPSAIKISGKSSTASGALKLVDGKLSGEVSVPLDTFATGISLRDKHMKEKYLETEKFPIALVKINPIAIVADDLNLNIKQEPFTGTLELHGKTQKVEGFADIQRRGDAFEVNASFRLRISDYAIAVPSYAGITVTNEVNVKTKLTAALAPEIKTVAQPAKSSANTEATGKNTGVKQ